MKAAWSEFRTLYESQFTPETVVGMKDHEETFTSILHTIAEKTIPKTSAFPENSTSPGGPRNGKKYTIIGRKLLIAFKKHPTTEQLNIYKREHARARRVFRESMKNTWKNYVPKLNDRTPINKTWDMIRKITGRGQSNGIKHRVKDGHTITNIKQISNTLGDTLSSNSSSKNYSNAFQNHKLQQEQTPLNFECDNIEDYNLPFAVKELPRFTQ